MLRPFPPSLTGLVVLGLSAAAVAAHVQLDLPAQPLSKSLTQLSQASGLQISADDSLIASKQAPAVRGSLEPAQALSRLLLGSGLDAQVQGNAVKVFQPASNGPMTLGNVDISAQTGIAGMATTEGSGSYTTGSISSATRLPLSIRETPQSVSVITRQRIEDQGMNDLNDVVKYAPGVTLRKFGSDRQQFLARGFAIDNLMYDGLPTIVSTFTLDTISGADLALYDRVEVVRGATGLMTGAGSPS
ncbi:outer membrane ferripyoverdine receptor, partial [Pseudomonas syringae pv. pisi str. 1704B]